MSQNAYYNTKETLIEKFADATAGETYAGNRLMTERLDNGNVGLVAYGWMKLAEYNERHEVVTVFDGHRAVDSIVVSRWINDVIRIAGRRREVVVIGESPTERQPNDGTRFIGGYVDFSTKLSSVEKDAVKLVEDSLRFLTE